MKAYTTPSLIEYGTAAAVTADSRENSTDDTFFNVNGIPSDGLGGSFDTCVTANDINCTSPGIRP